MRVLLNGAANPNVTFGRIVSIFLFAFLIGSGAVAQNTTNKDSSAILSAITSKEDYSEAELLDLLRSKDHQIRQFAVLQLAEQDTTTEKSINAVIGALGDRHENVRLQALACLMRCDSSLTYRLANILSDTLMVGIFHYHSEPLNGWRNIKTKKSDLAFAALYFARSISIDSLLIAYDKASSAGKKYIRILLSRNCPPMTGRVLDAMAGQDRELAATLVSRFAFLCRGTSDVVPLLIHMAEKRQDLRGEAMMALSNIPEAGTDALLKFINGKDLDLRRKAVELYPAHVPGAGTIFRRLLNDADKEINLIALRKLSYASGDMQDSVFNLLIGFLQHPDPSFKEAAIEILGVLADSTSPYSKKIFQAIFPFATYPVKSVRDKAIDQLLELAEKGLVPSSADLKPFIQAINSETHENRILELAGFISAIRSGDSLPSELIKKLTGMCRKSSADCYRIEEILNRHPGAKANALAMLIKGPPKLNEFTSEEFDALNILSDSGALYLTALNTLLSHPKKYMRINAAIELAEHRDFTGPVMDALAAGAEDFDGYAGPAGIAADKLIEAGDVGIQRLLTIVKNPRISKKTYEALIYYNVRKAAETSPQALDLLISYIKEANGKDVQASRVTVLPAVTPDMQKLKSILEYAFASTDARVRRAAVHGYASAKFDPSSILDKVYSDQDPEVRETIFDLLENLPGSNDRRIQFTELALRDADEDVREAAIRFTSQLGPKGEELLTKYVQSGHQLSSTVFSELWNSDSLSVSMIQALEFRKSTAPKELRDRIDKILGKHGGLHADRDKLFAQLANYDEEERFNAATSLVSLNEDIWQQDGKIATILMTMQVRNLVREKLGHVFDVLYPPQWTYTSAGGGPIPKFPWPPPPGYHHPTIIEKTALRKESVQNLGELYKMMVDCIEDCDPGFEHGLFLGIPDGFALVAKQERIKKDGTPFPGRQRWTQEGSPKSGLLNFLGDPYFEDPGYFRVIVFVVTTDRNPGVNPKASLMRHTDGAPFMPDTVKTRPFIKQGIVVLVYGLERKPKAKIKPWNGDGLSAKEQVIKSGIWNKMVRE